MDYSTLEEREVVGEGLVVDLVQVLIFFSFMHWKFIHDIVLSV